MTLPAEGYARVLGGAARTAITTATRGPVAIYSAADLNLMPEPPDRYAVAARRFAEQSCAQLDDLLPGGLGDVVEGVDLRAALTARLTLRLFLNELAPLRAFFARPALGRTLVVADAGLTDDQLRELFDDVRSAEHERPVLQARTSGPRVPNLKAARTLLRPAPRVRAPRLPTGGTLAFCGGDTDLAFLTTLVGPGDLVVAKSMRPEAIRACNALAAHGSTIVSAEQFLSLRRSRPERRHAAAAVRAVPAGVRRAGLGSAVRELELLVHSALSFSVLCDLVRPELVVGALERSPFGGLASAFRRAHGYQAVNVQHGTVMPARVMDLLDLDLCLAWNQWSVEAYERDGFRGRTVVVGNPRWDSLAQERSEAARTGGAATSWGGDVPLMVAFPQPLRGPYLTESSVTGFAKVLRDLLERRPDVHLLVKERSRSLAQVERHVLAALQSAGRVRFVAADDVSLAAALADADLAVSMYSTALADAVAAGVHAVSVDAGNFVAVLGLDFLSVIPVCRNSAELERELDRAVLGAPEVQSDRRKVFPTFAEPYSQRVATALGATAA